MPSTDPSAGPSRPGSEFRRARASILLVDDHPSNLLALEAILEPLGQDLVKAHSGEEALKALLTRDFACILMDVQMPGMDGFQTASLIKQRERTRHVPILFLTALSRDAAHVFKGYAHGAVDYLLKPFDPEILRSKVSVFVDLFLKEQQIQRQQAQLREREREALERESELRYRGLIDAMPAIVFAVAPDGKLRYRNRAWVDYAGEVPARDVEESLGRDLHPDDRGAALARWRQAVADGKPFEAEWRLRRHDGVYRWHLARGVPQAGPDGKRDGWVCTATDIEDQKQAEVALQLASEAKDAFLAAASHELRTPLAAAKGHAHLALMKMGEEAEAPGPGRSLKIINRQIDRMAKLVEDLLDVSRLQAGRLALEVERFDLPALVRETCDRMGVLSQTHSLHVEAPEHLEGAWDRGRLDQVLTNLLSNAIRYSPEGGGVWVRVEEKDAGVLLSVRDEGVGIPKDKQRVIFERFGRAHGSKYGGLGLGLTISQGIVEQHGGRIWVESEGVAGKGTSFFVQLPRETQAAHSADAEHDVPVKPPPGRGGAAHAAG